MEVRVFKTYEELSKEAAKVIINQVKINPTTILGLATGSSPIGLYQELIKDYKQNNTSYKNVKTFNLDEYYGIDRNHSQSYYYFMMENLFKHIDIDRNNIHIPNGVASNIEQECASYSKMLSENQVDIQVLGIGANGHIGFNEPGTPFDSKTHHVKLDEKTRIDNSRFFNSLDDVPKYAVTMGISDILLSKKIILVVNGINKSEAIYHLVKGNPTPDWPASSLQMHNDVIVFVDEAAAAKL